MNDFIETKSNGTINAKKRSNIRELYDHQRKAMSNLDIVNQNSSYSTLVVLPTGGGKTYTAAVWLLRNAIDKKKKVLWIAHRQTLLDQAAETFKKYPYSEYIPNISSFKYRIVSGETKHDRTIDIEKKDDLLIVSKDSMGRNLSGLDNWLKGENELFLIVDEAHHSTAKTYRRVIDYVKSKVSNVKLIGLTATPFRTAENEQGLLSKIYTDGIENGVFVHNSKGIAYQISLKELINRQILSQPVIETCNTGEEYGQYIGAKDLENIQNLDLLPKDLADKMVESAERNQIIAKTYVNNKKKYGPTIVFALNIPHALQLNKVFHEYGVKSDYIVSSIKDEVTGFTRSNEDNAAALEAYQKGKLQVLINVNILTEGVDLPQTQTVFLARPTVSKILMTQMIGRALRGEKAGGTKKAYIVSFIDNGLENIAWSNPDSIFEGNNDFIDTKSEYEKRDIRYISIAKIEEFAKMLNDAVDTSSLEKVPFNRRIPIGMYAFTNNDTSYQVMVYDSTQLAYKNLMKSLPVLFSDYFSGDDEISEKQFYEMAEQCRNTYFLGEMIPPYDEKDIINILKYYDEYGDAPSFYSFDDIDKSKIDVCAIAKHIVEQKMDPITQSEYIQQLWNEGDDNILRLLFGRQKYFYNQLHREILRIVSPYLFEDDEENIVYGKRYFEKMSLKEIGMINPKYEEELRSKAFSTALLPNGKYKCAGCGKKFPDRILLQVDHIIPLNKKEGKTVPENLQILCRSCNARKSDK
ncbi:DEAD/DEAH box helicase family protein [Ruminococcus flavefaciens]|uniref:DEAD/DEAH box helicase family protein n=1 Tax=Ruminococcus flavefaciens TaxID=1265 RepID=UPI0026F27A9E|nr:DEAD/DEAH box helicase family protein [Ruminococcus flavefaciens]